MNTRLQQCIENGGPSDILSYIDALDADHWSFTTFVDELVPQLVMESNLPFGSFHLIKMSLFLRDLSRRGLFSPETEKKVAGVIALHLYNLEWIRVTVDPLSHAPDPVDRPLEHMLDEIEDGNAHNAYFYASLACSSERDHLFNQLLQTGALSLSDSLGHSVSCFFPVLQDVIAGDHPAAGTSLFSLILYLCRYRRRFEMNRPVDTTPESDPAARSELLCRCASGTGIVNLHHMITYYIFHAWEAAAWNTDTSVPWHLLIDWVGEKRTDEQRLETARKLDPVHIPDRYEDWQKIFTGTDRQKIMDTTVAMADRSWEQTCDWMFRIYADYYTPDWDPHYYTSLYAALVLYKEESIQKDARRFALLQALEYFLEDIDPAHHE